MNNDKKIIRHAIIIFMQVGINMIVPIVLCVWAGDWLGKKFDISWLVVVFFFMGALAGYTNIYKLYKAFLKDTDKRKEKDVKKDK